MMFQPIDQTSSQLERGDLPDRLIVIQSDEIVNLRIDLETMDMDVIYEKYFGN